MALLSDTDPRLLPCPDRSGYTDPATLTRELRAFFARRWMLVGRGSEMPEPGDFLTVEVAGESVIVARQPDHTVRAMLNVCRHRGARILLEERGSCQRMLRCPYHSWSYGLDGTLLGAPNLREAVGPDQAHLGLQHVPVVEAHGCLWVSLEADPAGFDASITAQLRERLGSDEALGRWELERLVTGRQIRYDVGANWKLIVENFMECYHCSSIHPELVAAIPEFRGGVASQALEVGHGSALSEEAEGFTVDGRAGLPQLPELSETQQRAYYAITLFPNSFVNLFDDHVVLHRFTPLAADRTEVVCDWLFAPEALAERPDIDPTVELFDRVNRQDFEACERCQLGAMSRVYAHDNVLVPAEHHLRRLHDELRDALAGVD
jgi:phenylpropionate dioxygenase-like ring-hydroxylating dioxygenase large terminal subunit